MADDCLELPRFYRRVKPSENSPYGKEDYISFGKSEETTLGMENLYTKNPKKYSTLTLADYKPDRSMNCKGAVTGRAPASHHKFAAVPDQR